MDSMGERGSGRTRLRVNLAQREVEIEGGEAFVNHWAGRLGELLTTRSPLQPSSEGVEPAPVPDRQGPREPFGQFVQQLPNTATEVDRMLAAGQWLQSQSPDDTFATGEASRILSEHGFKIGNPSQAVRQSLSAKRVFMVQKGRYRVSQQGRQHLARLGAGA
jgi:hypothetical protein